MAWPEVDMSRDHEIWDAVETITYFSKTAEAPPATGLPVEGTLWLMIRKELLPPDSPLLKMDLTVDLPRLKLGAIVPKANDLMRRADGTFWTIKLVERVATEQEFRVQVVKSTKR